MAYLYYVFALLLLCHHFSRVSSFSSRPCSNLFSVFKHSQTLMIPIRKKTYHHVVLPKHPSYRRVGSDEWLYCLKSWPKSGILHIILNHILVVTAWTAIMAFVNMMLITKNIHISFPPIIHTLAGSVLSLLLVFRTNTSYDRFWEGRKMWGTIVDACRRLTRLTYVRIDQKYHKQVATLIMVFCVLLRQKLCDRSDLESPPELSEYLNKDDISYLMEQNHPPLIVLRRLEECISTYLDEKYLTTYPTLACSLGTDFRNYINILGGSMGACERIITSPQPYFYTINTSRYTSLFLFTLPFVLLPSLGWFAVPVMSALSWCFISIQEIGHLIEDPFNKKVQIVPMQELTSVVRLDICGK